ncbi:hypothetical protein D3C84_1226070 [compost metagenome]
MAAQEASQISKELIPGKTDLRARHLNAAKRLRHFSDHPLQKSPSGGLDEQALDQLRQLGIKQVNEHKDCNQR